jgi:hypothetical protein
MSAHEQQKGHHLLTKDKLVDMVKVFFKAKKVDMLDWSVRPAVAAGSGENFCGEVSRCEMIVRLDECAESKTLNWIVKSIAEKPLIPKEIIRVMQMERKEIEMYKKVIYINRFLKAQYT